MTPPRTPISAIGSRIHQDLNRAKGALEGRPAAVTIFGGSRVLPTSRYYRDTFALAEALSGQGISVMSGGGPGIMEAANKGAKAGGRGLSIGLNLELPFEVVPNEHQDVSLNFEHFSSRKIAFCKYSRAFIVMPGGIGTLDEVFEVLALIQSQKMEPLPVVLYGAEFWGGLIAWLRGTVLEMGLLTSQDVEDRMLVADSVDQVLLHLGLPVTTGSQA